MVLNKDFKEFIQLLSAHKVRYMVVGGYAVAAHGHPRYTKDLDIWVEVDIQNAQKIEAALHEFGFPFLSAADFMTPGEFVQLGYPPNRIDIITSCEGVEFDTCYPHRMRIEFDGVEMDFLGYEALLVNKKAVGRPQDLGDVDNLQHKE